MRTLVAGGKTSNYDQPFISTSKQNTLQQGTSAAISIHPFHLLLLSILATTMSSSIGGILELLVLQDWQTFRAFVLSSPALFRHISCAVSACSELNGMTLLHAAVRYNPPLDIIAQMIRLCPDMPAAKDCLDRTPLHVAAGSKASASVLKLLAHACPAACDVQDEEGCTPLHVACDSSCVLFDDDHDKDENDTSKQPPNHESVAVLLSYSILAATLEDDEEMTPLEHAIMSDASMKTVKLLQSATRVGMQLNEGKVSQRSFSTANIDEVRESMPHKKTRRISFNES